jgi:hypothetical protein
MITLSCKVTCYIVLTQIQSAIQHCSLYSLIKLMLNFLEQNIITHIIVDTESLQKKSIDIF